MEIRGGPVDAATGREHVQLTGRVLTEREHIAETHVEAPGGLSGDGAVRVGKAPHPAGAVVGVEVLPDERRRARAAVDKATSDRAAVPVAILDHGLHQTRAAAGGGVEAMEPLHDPPAVVQPSLSRRRDVHLFPKVLTDVGDSGIRADRVAFDPRVALVVGIVDVDVSVRGVARMERHAQQPLLTSRTHGAGDVQERSREELPVLHDPDPPLLLDNEESRIPRGRGQVQRTAEPARDELQIEGTGLTRQRRSTGRVSQTGRERAREDGTGLHLGPNTIAPLKFRTVTWAPPPPVENRSSCPALADRRRGWLAPSVLVIVPPIVSTSKSATVLAGTRTSMVPLWLSTSTTPLRPSSPSKRMSPVTDSNLPRCTPVPPRCHPAARTTMRPLNVDAPRSWLAPRSMMSPLTVFIRARAVPPATSTLPSIVSAVTSWGVPSTWMLPPWLLRSSVPSTPSTWMLAVADLTHTVAPRGTRTSMSAPVPTAPSIPSFRTCASPAA